jgi:hypothetical protein
MQPNPTRAALGSRRLRDATRQPAVTAAFPIVEHLVQDRRKRLLATRVAARAKARHTGALITLATLEGSRGRFDEVERLCRCALALVPGMRAARRNLSLALLEMGRHEEAERILDAMLAADYADAEAHWLRAASRLARGTLTCGWSEFDWRWRLPDAPLPEIPSAREWNNTPVRGRRLRLWSEPRLHDQVVFLSMLPDLLARQADLTVECDPRLLALLRRSFPAVRFVVAGTDDCAGESPCDFQLPFGSLARLLRPDITAFPKRTGYLVASTEEQMRWRAWLNGLGGGLKVGIVFRSDDPNAQSVPHCPRARHWLPLLRCQGVHFISLQADACSVRIEESVAGSSVQLHHPPGLDRREELDALCALTTNLDLVIAAPSAASAIAGAAGVPTWQLNSGIDWHGLNQPYSPWQPSVRRFYKPWDRGWDAELQRVAAELDRIAARPGAARIRQQA